jgi:hypothetical protein
MEYTLRENTAMEQCGFSGAPACSFIMSFYYFILSQKFQKITQILSGSICLHLLQAWIIFSIFDFKISRCSENLLNR